MSPNARTLLPFVNVPTTEVDSSSGLPSSVGTPPASLTIDVVEPVNDATLRRVLIVVRFASHTLFARGPRQRAGRAPISAYTDAAVGPVAAVPEARARVVPRVITPNGWPEPVP